MFDANWDDDDGNWEQEPTREEILAVINSVKLDIVNKYELPVLNSTSLQLMGRLDIQKLLDRTDYKKRYEAARLCLAAVIAAAKTLTPHHLHHLYDKQLNDWIPHNI